MTTNLALSNNDDWRQLVAQLPPLGGVAMQLAYNCTFRDFNGRLLQLDLDPSASGLRSAITVQRLRQRLESVLGRAIELAVRVYLPPENRVLH